MDFPFNAKWFNQEIIDLNIIIAMIKMKTKKHIHAAAWGIA